MSDESKKKTTRRVFLVGGIGVVAGFCVAAFSIPSLQKLTSLWFRIARNPKTLTNTEVDLQGLQPGETMSTVWNNRPIYILRRTPEMIENVKNLTDSQIRFVNFEMKELPQGTDPILRSKEPEYLVVDGLCTHLGCSLAPMQPGQSELLPIGGFFCGCHGGRFDLAGRVLHGTAPPENLIVPPHYYKDATTLVIGQNDPF